MAEHTWNISPLHCGISVSNLEASIEWFGRVLDFEVVSRDSIPAAGFDLVYAGYKLQALFPYSRQNREYQK